MQLGNIVLKWISPIFCRLCSHSCGAQEQSASVRAAALQRRAVLVHSVYQRLARQDSLSDAGLVRFLLDVRDELESL